MASSLRARLRDVDHHWDLPASALLLVQQYFVPVTAFQIRFDRLLILYDSIGKMIRIQCTEFVRSLSVGGRE
jgi:hypothetical protein